MWQSRNVERALFSWPKWRQSIVAQWTNLSSNLEKLDVGQLRRLVSGELNTLSFPSSLWLEIYWICCVTCDYNQDNPTTFENMAIPDWLPALYNPLLWHYKIESGMRPLLPPIQNEKDIAFQVKQIFGPNFTDITRFYPGEQAWAMFLPSGHELYEILSKFKGRPKISKGHGKASSLSDRLAVRCATLKDDCRKTYVEIARQCGLSVTRPYDSWQSDETRHLVNRGREVIMKTFSSGLGKEKE
ncbi:hypothetical protein ES703_38945 [subsurface metagenome]